MAATTVQKLVLELQSRGVNATAAELEHLASSFLRVEQSSSRSASKLEATVRALDPLTKALAQQERLQRLVNDQVAKGITLEERHTRALKAAQEQVDKARRASGGSNDNVLNSNSWLNLSRQGQDVAVSLAGGQSPLQVLLQQGSQVYDVFASSGSASTALKEFGATVARYALNPVTLLTVGIGAAGAAFLKFDADQRELERSLNGVGRAAGATAEQIRTVAEIAASRGGLTSSQGISAAATFAGAGIDQSLIGNLTQSSRRYAGAFGLDQASAVSELAKVFADPAKGIDDLEKRFGALDGTTRRYIETLSAQGRLTEAQKALYAAFSVEINKTTDATSALSQKWQELVSLVTKPIGALDNTLRHMRDGLSLQEQLTKARGEYFYLNAQRKGDASFYPGESDAQKRVQEIERKIQEQEQAQIDAQRRRDAAFMAGKAAPVLSAADPLIGTRRSLHDSAELFRNVQNNDLALKQLGITRGKAAEIADKMAAREKMLADESTKVREQTDAKTRSLATYSEKVKADIEAQKVYKDVFRDTGDSKLAAEKAYAIRAESVARVSSAIRDYNDAAKDQLSQAGLTPYQKAQKQIIQEGQKFAEQYGGVPSGVADKLAALQKETTFSSLTQPTMQAEAEMEILARKNEMLGASTEKMSEVVAWNQKYNDLVLQGVNITPNIIEQIDAYAASQGRLAKATEDANQRQQQFVDGLDTIRSTVKDVGESLVNAFRRGENAGQALLSVLDRLSSRIIDKSLDTVVGSLFGKTGSTDAGILGPIAKGLFGFANGGIMTSAGPMPLMAYADGGVANRPQMALFGEGRRPEAFVPLPDGRNIPVKMQGKQQTAAPKITIINNAGAQVEARQASDGELLIVVDKMIRERMKAVPNIVADAQLRSI